jgi:hypothetical protein
MPNRILRDGTLTSERVNALMVTGTLREAEIIAAVGEMA